MHISPKTHDTLFFFSHKRNPPSLFLGSRRRAPLSCISSNHRSCICSHKTSPVNVLWSKKNKTNTSSHCDNFTSRLSISYHYYFSSSSIQQATMTSQEGKQPGEAVLLDPIRRYRRRKKGYPSRSGFVSTPGHPSINSQLFAVQSPN